MLVVDVRSVRELDSRTGWGFKDDGNCKEADAVRICSLRASGTVADICFVADSEYLNASLEGSSPAHPPSSNQ